MGGADSVIRGTDVDIGSLTAGSSATAGTSDVSDPENIQTSAITRTNTPAAPAITFGDNNVESNPADAAAATGWLAPGLISGAFFRPLPRDFPMDAAMPVIVSVKLPSSPNASSSLSSSGVAEMVGALRTGGGVAAFGAAFGAGLASGLAAGFTAA
jgi:hypothetical protein